MELPIDRLPEPDDLKRWLPIVGWALDKGSKLWNTMRKKRAAVLENTIADELNKVAPELWENEEFVDAFFSCVDAALRTKRDEKIRWLGRLLIGATKARETLLDYKYYERILDELEPEEIGVLFSLARWEEKNPEFKPDSDEAVPIEQEDEFDALIHADWTSEIWSKFEMEVQQRYGISQHHLQAMLSRLEGKGLFLRFHAGHGGWPLYGSSTPLYRELERLCRIELDELLRTESDQKQP